MQLIVGVLTVYVIWSTFKAILSNIREEKSDLNKILLFCKLKVYEKKMFQNNINFSIKDFILFKKLEKKTTFQITANFIW